MKRWAVSDIRWANLRDLNLPFWRKWNRQNPLPNGFWQRIWEYPYLCSRIPKHGTSIDIGGTYPFVLLPNFPRAVSVDCRELNALDHPLHQEKWPTEKLIACDAANVPHEDSTFDYAFSISAIQEIPHMFDVLREMLRLARHRVVVTMDVSDAMGIPHKRLAKLEQFLGVCIPTLPADALNSLSPALRQFGQQQESYCQHIRVLGFTIDARDTPRSVAILIPHWESWPFLRLCVNTIKKQRNPALDERIYILDDASADGSFEQAQRAYADDPSVRLCRIERANKDYDADIGLLLDKGLELVTEQYVAAIDADVFPLSADWLAFPIWLLERYRCSAVGTDTGLSTAYVPRVRGQVWWQPPGGYIPEAGLYDNEWFTCTNNFYRIMTTATAKVVAESIGFSRRTPRPHPTLFVRALRARSAGLRRRLKLAQTSFPYLGPGCDNGVAANHFIDVNRLGPKFNLPITSYIGLTPRDGAFGQNVAGLIYHFALSTRALSRFRREVQDTGTEFAHWVERLQQSEQSDEQMLAEMVAASAQFQAGGYDGSIPASWYEREYDYIQHLRAQFHEGVTTAPSQSAGG